MPGPRRLPRLGGELRTRIEQRSRRYRRHGRCSIAEVTLGDLGEFAVIDRIIGLTRDASASAVVGNGDDAAVLSIGGTDVVIATDSVVKDRHFRLDWSSGRDIGAKAVARSCADVAAMGGRTAAVVVAMCAPAGTDVQLIEDIAAGVREECERAGASVVGGDTAESPVLSLAVTAVGAMGSVPPVTRGGAQPGDVLVVMGELGRSAAGMRQLLAGGGPLVPAHLRPQPDYLAGPALAAAGASALIDISDGLVGDVGHLARASGVRIDIVSAAIPLADGVELSEALTGGEDHAFAATIAATASLPVGATVIGAVHEGEGVTVDGGQPGASWEHFR